MAMTEIALEVEEELTVKRKPTMSALRPKMKEVHHAYRSFMLSYRWKRIFTMSCLLSVSVDPLFLYIPVTNEDMKCLRLDQSLKTVTLLLRSAVDLPCILHVISQILAARPRRGCQNILDAGPPRRQREMMLWSYFLIDILAILPVPQVIILILLTRTRGSKSMNERKFLNSLILFQYFPRIFRMYQSCKANKEEADNARYGDNGHRIWLRVYKFILASHVLGAFWYFFSIQREMDCWQYSCQRENKCANTFECGDYHTFKNLTFLNDLCPISTPNPTLFNFGIFLNALQSDILRSTDFPQKLLHCFWWGLRSLSSFGQNLETSTYAWENLFALGISVVGMILFLIYLNAILQFANTTSERHKREMISKEVDLWLTREGLPSSLKEVIMNVIDQRLKQNKDVEVDNILSVLPSPHRKYIQRYCHLTMLKKVPLFQTMGVNLLKAICARLQPETYTEDSCIIQEGELLHKMIFIAEGTVQTYKTSAKGGKIGSEFLEKGAFYGAEELLNWASKFSSSNELPISTRMVKPVTKVEVFELSADDLKSLAIKYWWNFTKKKDLGNFDQSLLEKYAVSSIEKEIRRRRHAKRKLQ